VVDTSSPFVVVRAHRSRTVIAMRLAFANGVRNNGRMPREVIWMRPESAGVGRPAEHSRREITRAAVAVADTHGFGAVTMRRVAGEIGTGAASLYRYVDNRGDLVDLMIDAIYAEMELRPTGEGWRADLLEVARQAIEVGTRHPWFVEALTEKPIPSGPNVVRLIEHSLTALADHPAPGPRKMEAISVMGAMMWLFGGVLARRSIPELVTAQAAYLQHVAREGGHPQLAAVLSASAPPGGPAITAGHPDDLLARTLGLVLDGILGPDGTG
jgi:AcrR family transcriptional regulator